MGLFRPKKSAAENEQEKQQQAALKAEADWLNTAQKDCLTALSDAFFEKRPDRVKALLAVAAFPNRQDFEKACTKVIREGDAQMFETLIERCSLSFSSYTAAGNEVQRGNVTSNFTRAMFEEICFKKDLEIFQFLSEKNAEQYSCAEYSYRLEREKIFKAAVDGAFPDAIRLEIGYAVARNPDVIGETLGQPDIKPDSFHCLLEEGAKRGFAPGVLDNLLDKWSKKGKGEYAALLKSAGAKELPRAPTERKPDVPEIAAAEEKQGQPSDMPPARDPAMPDADGYFMPAKDILGRNLRLPDRGMVTTLFNFEAEQQLTITGQGADQRTIITPFSDISTAAIGRIAEKLTDRGGDAGVYIIRKTVDAFVLPPKEGAP